MATARAGLATRRRRGRQALRRIGAAPLRVQRLREVPQRLGPRLLERQPLWRLGMALPVLGRRLGAGHGVGAGLGPVLLGLRLVPVRDGLLPYMNPYYADAFVAALPGRAVQLRAADRHLHAAGRRGLTEPGHGPVRCRPRLFQQGNYADALKQTDPALTKLPSDTTLHEFRGLCLFALGGTTRPPRPSTPCFRSGRAGTGRL